MQLPAKKQPPASRVVEGRGARGESRSQAARHDPNRFSDQLSGFAGNVLQWVSAAFRAVSKDKPFTDFCLKGDTLFHLDWKW